MKRKKVLLFSSHEYLRYIYVDTGQDYECQQE